MRITVTRAACWAALMLSLLVLIGCGGSSGGSSTSTTGGNSGNTGVNTKLTFVYTSNRSGHWHVYRAVNGQDTQLTSGSNDEFDPSLSPDGHTVAYLSDVNAGLHTYNLYLLNLTTQQVTPLSTTADYIAGYGTTFTPDGTGILVRREVLNGTVRNAGLYRCAVDGSGSTWVVPDADGGMMNAQGDIVYARANDGANTGSDIYLHPASGSDVRLTQEGGAKSAAQSPRFTPDGTQILYAHKEISVEYSVRAIKPDGSGLRTICTNDLPIVAPVISPDGGTVLFTAAGRDADTHLHIYAVNATGGTPQLLVNSGADDQSPSF